MSKHINAYQRLINGGCLSSQINPYGRHTYVRRTVRAPGSPPRAVGIITAQVLREAGPTGRSAQQHVLKASPQTGDGFTLHPPRFFPVPPSDSVSSTSPLTSGVFTLIFCSLLILSFDLLPPLCFRWSCTCVWPYSQGIKYEGPFLAKINSPRSHFTAGALKSCKCKLKNSVCCSALSLGFHKYGGQIVFREATREV